MTQIKTKNLRSPISLWVALLSLVVTVYGNPCALAREEEEHYLVVQVTGEVLTREPLEAHWTKVEKGMLLKRGRLIQTTQGASVHLETYGLKQGDEGSLPSVGQTHEKTTGHGKSVLKIGTPMIVRIQPDLYRKVTVSRYFIEDVPALATLHRPKTGPLKALNDAWNKVSLQVTGGSAKKSALLKLAASEDGQVDLSTNAQKIDLISPPPDALMRAPRLPFELQLSWTHPREKVRSYLIYLWQIDRERPPPLSQTKLDRDILLVPTLGEYLVQVTSDDGKWQTDPQVLRVVPMAAKKGEASQGTALTTVGSIRALYPPKSLTIFASRKSALSSGEAGQADLSFQWRLDGAWHAKEFDLVVVDPNGKEVHRSTVKGTKAHVKLPLGDYAWWVEAAVAPRIGSVQDHTSLGIGSRPLAKVAMVRSESRQLFVSQPLEADQRRSWLKARIKDHKPGAIYLSDGL